MKVTSVLVFPCSIPLWYNDMENSRLACPSLLHSFWIRGWSCSAASSPSHKLHLSSSLHAFTQLALLMIMCSTVSLAGVAYVNTPLTLLIRDRLLAASPGDEQICPMPFSLGDQTFRWNPFPTSLISAIKWSCNIWELFNAGCMWFLLLQNKSFKTPFYANPQLYDIWNFNSFGKLKAARKMRWNQIKDKRYRRSWRSKSAGGFIPRDKNLSMANLSHKRWKQRHMMHVIHYSLKQVRGVPSNCSVATVFLIPLKSCLLEKPLEGDQLPVFELTPLPFGTASLPSPSPTCSQFRLPYPEI